MYCGTNYWLNFERHEQTAVVFFPFGMGRGVSSVQLLAFPNNNR